MKKLEVLRKMHGLTRAERVLVQEHYSATHNMKSVNELIRELRRKRGFNARTAS